MSDLEAIGGGETFLKKPNFFPTFYLPPTRVASPFLGLFSLPRLRFRTYHVVVLRVRIVAAASRLRGRGGERWRSPWRFSKEERRRENQVEFRESH